MRFIVKNCYCKASINRIGEGFGTAIISNNFLPYKEYNYDSFERNIVRFIALLLLFSELSKYG